MNFLVLCLAFAAIPALAATEDREGRFYETDQAPGGNPLFLQRIHRETDEKGHRVSDSTIEDPEGKVVMTEHAELDGDQILTQRVDQIQIGESYELEAKDGKVHFRTYRLKGEKREIISQKAQDKSERFLTGPGTEPFLAAHFGKSGAGTQANVDFGIFELERSVGFEFEKKGEVNGGKTVKVRLRPQSFWLSLLVSPIDMEFDSKTFTLLRYKGRTPVRRQVHGSWKPLDAIVIYTKK